MVKVSLIIPVYNEIRFIQKTLESVVGDADEIILSDNASTDGSSDICQSFANKYPEIKYTRHKENMGAIKNFNFCKSQISGKYVRHIGAHDMISIGSNQSMASILDKHADIAMVYPKYVIGLKEDYSFERFHTYGEEFENDLLSDSAMTRTRTIISTWSDMSIFFGLWRTEIFKDVNSPRIYTQICTDVITVAATAAKGKMFPDEKSIFFIMNPRSVESTREMDIRYINAMAMPSNTNLSFWCFAIFAEQYDLVLEMFKENPEFCQEMLNILLANYTHRIFYSDITLENMPPIIPQKQELCQNCLNLIKEYKERQKAKQKTILNWAIVIFLKKLVKNILPYYLVKNIRLVKKLL